MKMREKRRYGWAVSDPRRVKASMPSAEILGQTLGIVG